MLPFSIKMQGRECWIDQFGQRTKPSFKLGELHWERYLLNSSLPFPPIHERDICTYLAEESEEDGLLAYINFALPYWYQQYHSFGRISRSQQDLDDPVVHFVCFDQLNDPATQAATFHEMMDWLYPWGQYDGSLDPVLLDEAYVGGHSTNHDPALRNRLRQIVVRLDEIYFSSTLTRETEVSACGVGSASVS